MAGWQGDVVTLFNGAHESTGLTSEKIAIGIALLAAFAAGAVAEWLTRRK